ncbi:conserved hypothetical protein [Tenacibaculum halocynthiae]
MVSAVPFISADVFFAINVEKRGESAITKNPQKKRKPIKTLSDSVLNIIGEIRQQVQDNKRAMKAIRLVPNT